MSLSLSLSSYHRFGRCNLKTGRAPESRFSLLCQVVQGGVVLGKPGDDGIDDDDGEVDIHDDDDDNGIGQVVQGGVVLGEPGDEASDDDDDDDGAAIDNDDHNGQVVKGGVLLGKPGDDGLMIMMMARLISMI